MLSFLPSKRTRRALALLLAAVLVLSPLSALAETYDIGDGDISVVISSDGIKRVDQGYIYSYTESCETIITGTTTRNVITLSAAAGTELEVTIQDLNIQSNNMAPITTRGEGDVTIELDGDSTLIDGHNHAGLQKGNDGALTIQDLNDTAGSLTATGGRGSAGIGGERDQGASDITITGGTVTANGGQYAAGIGGGWNQGASDITITGGTVTANGGENAAGIGGGDKGDGTNIDITGGTVTANGGENAAGIGGGSEASGKDITVSGGAVTATGGEAGAGIGGGLWGDGTNITIDDGTVTANGGENAAGIGGGDNGDGIDIHILGGTVEATGGQFAAGIGGGSTASGGAKGKGDKIEISGGTVVATGENGGPGIGGDYLCGAGSVTVSGDAQVSVAGGKSTYTPNYYYKGDGAAIGTGGMGNSTYPGKEAEPNTNGLTTGHIDYYAPGTTADEIQNGEAEPVRTIRGTIQTGHEACRKNGHTPGEAVKENELAATDFEAGSYDLVTYCTVCGEALRRETVTVPALLDPFTQFSVRLAERVSMAPENGVVEADAGTYAGLHRLVLAALRDREDVTLKIACQLDGQRTELTVPAGFDLLTPLGETHWIPFAEMAKLLG